MDPSTLEYLIIREIRKASSISRRDLAERLEVHRSTAGRRVDSLVERGVLLESGVEEKFEAGRPKRFLDLRGDFGRFIGFDFDAHYLYGVLTDFAQKKLSAKRVSLGFNPSKTSVIKIIRSTAEEFKIESDKIDILGYGVGIPGRVKQQEGIALHYPYIKGWKNVNLAADLNLDPQIVHLENNTKTIALGEYWLGHDIPPDHMVCLNIRRGISTAIVSNGQLLRGSHEMAGEIRGWHQPGQSNPKLLEEIATTRAILGEESLKGWNNYVKKCLTGDALSLSTLDTIIRYHADTVSRLVQISDPDLVVIGGAFNDLGDLYLDQLRTTCAEMLAGSYFNPPPIQFVSNDEYTGALGAAALAAKNFKLSC